ncbi:hypothetical protein FRC06_003346 [Ceratobasidium sp. 370]|nr:hypothetical protein FRC06_003346 [Ceratobasidium sp. 370]
MPPLDLPPLPTIMVHLMASRHFSFAGYVVLIYDHILTFGDEVELVWSQPTSVVSMIFLVAPVVLAVDIYDKGGLTRHVSREFCRTWVIIEGYLNLLLLAAIHVLMVMRVHALWGNQRWLRHVLVVAYSLYFATSFAILTAGLLEIARTCIIFALTAVRAWQYAADGMQLPIVHALYKDGFQYFIGIMLCTLFPSLVWSIAPPTLVALPKYGTMGNYYQRVGIQDRAQSSSVLCQSEQPHHFSGIRVAGPANFSDLDPALKVCVVVYELDFKLTHLRVRSPKQWFSPVAHPHLAHFPHPRAFFLHIGSHPTSVPSSRKFLGTPQTKPTTTQKTKSAKFTSTKSGATETETTDSSAPTSGTGGISISDKLLAVFPAGVKSGLSRWSTNPAVSGALTLNDQTLRATKTIKELSHPVVDFAGKKAMKVDDAKVLTFSYSVQFAKGFAFNKGGKLPGLYGGTSNDEATGCSGGRTRATCWSLRYMWRAEGEGELYAYLPSDAESTNKANVCHEGSKPNKTCDLGYGWSLGRGSWKWTPGTWQTIAQRITLNDVGKANGSGETYIDGKKIHTVDNVIIRNHKNAIPRGAMIQSFFGGSDGGWASPKDQQVYFADFSLAVLETE